MRSLSEHFRESQALKSTVAQESRRARKLYTVLRHDLLMSRSEIQLWTSTHSSWDGMFEAGVKSRREHEAE